MKTKDHLIWADVLRVISIYAVVVIHASAPLLEKYRAGAQQWWIGNVYDSISRWCIPVFIMLSGALLLDKIHLQSLYHFYLRRFERVLVPFISWIFLYFFWRKYFNHEEISTAFFMASLLREPAYYHLWFMYVIVALYALAPFICLFTKSASYSSQFWFFFVWFVLGSFTPMFFYLLHFDLPYPSGFVISLMSYIGYFMAGFFLKNLKLRSLQFTFVIIVLAFSFVFTSLGTYFINRAGENSMFIDFYYRYNSFNVVVMSLCVFVIMRNVTIPALISQNEVSLRLISFVASCVPGIYFIHAMLIGIAKRGSAGLIFTEMTFNPIIGIPVFAAAIFAGSLVIVLIIKMIPILRRIVP